MKLDINSNQEEEKMEGIKLVTLSKFPERLIQSFAEIPEDTYLKETFCYRKRCYGTGCLINGIFSWDEESPSFVQSESLNRYVGGISRQFHPISCAIRDDIEKQVICMAYGVLPASDYSLGIHQIRIVANKLNQGMPTPEGIHQDGFDFVTVACIGASNVSGGISFILDAHDHTKIAFEGTLQPGMLLIFSDKTFAHYTSNISPKLPGEAHRDVIVTTFQTLSNPTTQN